MGLALPFLLLTITFILWKLFCRYLYALKIPTVQPAHPIFGHAQLFMRKNLQEVFWSIVKIFNGVDRVAKVRFGLVPVVLVNHPDLLQELMNRAELDDKPFLYDYLGLGSGLISEPRGQSWRCSRKLLNPTFSTKILHNFIPIMDDTVKAMVRNLETLAQDGAEFDIYPQVSQGTLEIVFNTTMGCRVEEREGAQKYIQCFEKITACLGERFINMDQYFEPIYRLSSTYSIEKANRDFCFDFGGKIIDERRAKKVKIPDKDEEVKTLNFLDQILTIKHPDGRNFSDDEIKDHISTIIVAGNETSALTTSFACLNLAMEPDVQSKVVTEIKQVFHSPSVEVTPETLRQLFYLEMVIKETLRLCPPVPFVARSTAAPIQLDGFQIPKDQIICFNFYNLHRRKDFWGNDDDLERFDPERFRPELVKERHPYAYLPFSGGHRSCIGGRFAMNSLKIMLLRIVQNFELSTSLKRQDLRFCWKVAVKLVGPYAVRLKKRDLYRYN